MAIIGKEPLPFSHREGLPILCSHTPVFPISCQMGSISYLSRCELLLVLFGSHICGEREVGVAVAMKTNLEWRVKERASVLLMTGG